MKAILVFSILVLIVAPCLAYANEKPIDGMQSSLGLLEAEASGIYPSSVNQFNGRIANDLSSLAEQDGKSQLGDCGDPVLDSVSPWNTRKNLETLYQYADNGEQNGDNLTANKDKRKDLLSNLKHIYESDTRQDNENPVGEGSYAHLSIYQNLDTLTQFANDRDNAKQILIVDQDTKSDIRGNSNYVYERKNSLNKFASINAQSTINQDIDIRDLYANLIASKDVLQDINGNLEYIYMHENNQNKDSNVHDVQNINNLDYNYDYGNDLDKYDPVQIANQDLSIIQSFSSENKADNNIIKTTMRMNSNLASMVDSSDREQYGTGKYASAPFSIRHSSRDSSRKVALIIGINDYNSMPNLHNCVNDADAISDIIGSYGYNVIKITDKTPVKPTKQNLEAALSRIAQNYRDGKVLIYYSGHGKIDYNGSFYFVPKDGNESFFTYIPGKDLDQETRDLENLAIIIDACNSGAFVADNPGRIIITSSGANEPSNEEWLGKMSVFTKYLCETLERERAKGKEVALQDCFAKASNDTKKWTLWPLLSQTPQMIGLTDGSYILN